MVRVTGAICGHTKGSDVPSGNNDFPPAEKTFASRWCGNIAKTPFIPGRCYASAVLEDADLTDLPC